MDLQKRAEAGKAGAEGGEPPEAVGHAVAERMVERKEAGRTAHIAVAEKNGGTGFCLLFRQLEFPAQGAQHLPPPACQIQPETSSDR